MGPGRSATLTAAILGACAIGAAAAGDSSTALERALTHCAAIASDNDRLACYDALASGHPRGGVQPPPTTPPAAPQAAQPAAQPAAPSAAPPPAKEDFGLSTVQKEKKQPVQKQIESISASVTGLGTSSIGRMLVYLDNGQSWELDSADSLLAAGDKVTIERGALGSFLLTTPSRRTHHARRLH
jgi:hypothetical protein